MIIYFQMAANNVDQLNQITEHKENLCREFDKTLDKSRKIFKKSEIIEMITKIKNAKGNPNKKDHYLFSTYQVLEISNVECLIKKIDTQNEIKKVVAKPIISTEFMNRGQLDLIEFQTMPDGIYKCVGHYQDHHNKFSFLFALTSKCAREVALKLIEIFSVIGAPCILQMDNGREFAAKVIEELKLIWPDLTIVHGKARHPQSQGSVKRANGDVKKQLQLWMADNQTTKWTLGLKFVQIS